MGDVIASVDIGATKIAVAISNREGIIYRSKQPVIIEGEKTAIPLQVREMIEEGLFDSGKKVKDLLGVGISSCGPFRKVDGRIELVSPNICGGMAPERGIIPNDWYSIPIEEELENYFRNIVIKNDAVSGVIAERTFGIGEGFNDIVYVTWSTGIGTGAYVDGCLIGGKNGNAPHGGHIFLGNSGPACGCGSVGHLEALASGTSIAMQYDDNISTEEVFSKYHEGDENAVRIIDLASKNFARGLASINAILDTKLITIGGSVFLNNHELLLPKVREEFYRSFPLLSQDVEVLPTGLGEYLGDVAAISLVIPDEWIDDWKERKLWESSI